MFFAYKMITSIYKKDSCYCISPLPVDSGWNGARGVIIGWGMMAFFSLPDYFSCILIFLIVIVRSEETNFGFFFLEMENFYASIASILNFIERRRVRRAIEIECKKKKEKTDTRIHHIDPLLVPR